MRFAGAQPGICTKGAASSTGCRVLLLLSWTPDTPPLPVAVCGAFVCCCVLLNVSSGMFRAAQRAAMPWLGCAVVPQYCWHQQGAVCCAGWAAPVVSVCQTLASLQAGGVRFLSLLATLRLMCWHGSWRPAFCVQVPDGHGGRALARVVRAALAVRLLKAKCAAGGVCPAGGP